jgi:hypothetical protein
LRPWAFVTEGSAARFLDRIAAAIAADTAAQDILHGPEPSVMSDLKARVKSSGNVAIKALYWSVRCADPKSFGGLRARTLLAGPDHLRWIDMPNDPALPELARLAALPGCWRMLRYVPLRRATVLHEPPGKAAPYIIKLKRPDRAREAAGRLRAAQLGLGPDPGFGMPQLLGQDKRGTFQISLCAGTPLSHGFVMDLHTTMRRVGQMHAQLHAAQPLGLPAATSSSANDNLALAGALMPGIADKLAPSTALLRDRPLLAEPVLCHGDFSTGQILQADDALSLVDFDLCHVGEAAADIARFLVSLPEDLPAGADAQSCAAAYLEGYRARRALPDAGSLRWHRVQAVIDRLLVCLRKDQADPSRIDRLLAQIEGVPA